MTNPASRPRPTASPSRPPESAIEVSYNTAVQSFVRRDHVKTHAILTRLLSTLRKQSRTSPRRRWYDFDPTSSAPVSATGLETEEWLVKTLKLLVGAHASLYADPPASMALDSELAALLPPSPPSALIDGVYQTCVEAYPTSLLPPSLVSTLILACLKLGPAESSLEAAHRITEEWIAHLPDSFVRAISIHGQGGADAEEKKRLEAAREGYLKVIELFTGEVLAREGEWEMARGILDGESVMSSNRKEALYRHLRALQTRRENPQASPSNSGILPSPSSSGLLPPPSEASSTVKGRSRRTKSRSSSTSSSSSEATARPGANGLALSKSKRPSPTKPDVKGKGPATDEYTGSELSSLPSRIHVNPPPAPVARPSSSMRDVLDGALAMMPPAIRERLLGLSASQIAGVVIPLPVIALVVLLVSWRRRLRRRQATELAAGGVVAADQVRERLRQIRERGVWQWVLIWLRWWMKKFQGIWKLGTTITYF